MHAAARSAVRVRDGLNGTDSVWVLEPDGVTYACTRTGAGATLEELRAIDRRPVPLARP